MEKLVTKELVTVENGDSFYLTLDVLPALSTDDIVVTINEFNEQPINYVYRCKRIKSDENIYLNTIKEAIEEFQQDKAVQKLLNWDGKLKYKISL